ncbi:hypothetical protein D9758_015846 [Tetrapyrgos nigripes]|uniref:NAD(P)-binding domain-containing protein n=1 Tax=Tetrapyrgos nigripes TaxID=182062 RepID=A0A8H5C953_9AGAR|nr:hypothetical protein D9758_015846 [Tetrapyrgos nigripes]
MKLILTGATGAAGSQILKDAVLDPAVTSVTVLARRALPDWLTSTIPENNKTTTLIVNDFSKYPEDLPAKLASHDACIWALGSTSVGKTEQEYTVVTYDYVVKMVEALGEVGKVRENNKEPFRFVYVSGNGADQDENSASRMFARVKGRTEKYLLSLPPSSKIQSYALRPGGFFPDDPNIMKNTRSTSERFILGLVRPVMSTFMSSRLIPVGDLSRFALEAAKGKWDSEPEKVFSNAKMKELVAGN